MENIRQKQKREVRDREILRLYPDLTLEEISKKYGLTRERVRQILNKLNNEK